MPRYDKYDPYSGGFRAPAALAVSREDKNVLTGAGLDDAGRVIRNGSGSLDATGVVIAHDAKNPGDILDIMTSGEIVEMEDLNPGTSYYVQADGSIGDEPTELYVGHTVEATRLVVRFQRLTATEAPEAPNDDNESEGGN